MPRAAVAVASKGEPDAHGRRSPDTGLQDQLSALGRQIGHGRRFRPGRSQLLLVGLAIVGAWLFFVFGGALSQLNEAEDRHAALSAENAVIEQRLEAGRRELALVQTDAFQALEARSYGFGEAGEQVFALDSDAPAPRIVPLGGSPGTVRAETPLDAWLRLLLGS